MKKNVGLYARPFLNRGSFFKNGNNTGGYASAFKNMESSLPHGAGYFLFLFWNEEDEIR